MTLHARAPSQRRGRRKVRVHERGALHWPKSKLRKVHLTFGILVLIIFLLTGQYMDKYYNHMVGVPDGIRLLYRTRHIFILLSGLTNLGIGAYFTFRPRLWGRVLQLVGSALTFLSSVLFTLGFFYEPGFGNLRTPLSHWGVYCIVAGVLLHLFSGINSPADRNPAP
jgi:hypothetical protein